MQYLELSHYAVSSLGGVAPGTVSLGAPTIEGVIQVGNGTLYDGKVRLEVCRFDSELNVRREDGQPLQVAITEARYDQDAVAGEKFSKERITLFDEPVDSVRFVHYALAGRFDGRRSWFIVAPRHIPNVTAASRFASTIAEFAKIRQ